MTRRRWSIAAIVALGLVLSAAALWWQLPGIARWLVVRQLEAVTGRRLTVERFDLALARGRLEIRGLRLADREPGPSLAEIDRLDARFVARALLRGRLDVHEATIDGLRVRIVRNERGELNIADLLRRPPSTGAPPAVTIDRLVAHRGCAHRRGSRRCHAAHLARGGDHGGGERAVDGGRGAAGYLAPRRRGGRRAAVRRAHRARASCRCARGPASR